MSDADWRFPASLSATEWSAADAGDERRAGEALPDELLLQRAARGDESSFIDLINRHESRLREFVRYTLGAHAELLDDVMQEVRLQLHRSSPTFTHKSTFRTWLYGLAKNVCRHQLRRRRRHSAFELNAEEPMRHVVDVQLNPLEALAQAERHATIRRAVETLPDPLRMVLKLRDWDELSYAQIAETLDIPIGTVRSRLHNARVLLAKRLDEFNPERET
jgi:RNA polymerase sigma-70 factor (ECF subfamily)